MNIRTMVSIMVLCTSFVVQAAPKKMSAAAAKRVERQKAEARQEAEAIINAANNAQAARLQSQTAAQVAAAAKRAAKENEIARLTRVAEELEAQAAAAGQVAPLAQLDRLLMTPPASPQAVEHVYDPAVIEVWVKPENS